MLKYTIGYTKDITFGVSDVYKKLSLLMGKSVFLFGGVIFFYYLYTTIYNE